MVKGNDTLKSSNGNIIMSVDSYMIVMMFSLLNHNLRYSFPFQIDRNCIFR